MTTHPQSIRCPWCGAQPTAPCTVPPGPGAKRKVFHETPLKLTSWHPARIEAALTRDGFGGVEIERMVAGVLAAATGKYREQPQCARMPDIPVAPKPSPPPDPENPSAGQPAPNNDPSGAAAEPASEPETE